MFFFKKKAQNKAKEQPSLKAEMNKIHQEEMQKKLKQAQQQQRIQELEAKKQSQQRNYVGQSRNRGPVQTEDGHELADTDTKPQYTLNTGQGYTKVDPSSELNTQSNTSMDIDF